MSSNRAFEHFTKKSPNLNFKDYLNIGKTSAQFQFSCWRWKAIFVDLKIAQWGSELWRVSVTADRLTTLVTLKQERWLRKSWQRRQHQLLKSICQAQPARTRLMNNQFIKGENDWMSGTLGDGDWRRNGARRSILENLCHSGRNERPVESAWRL